MLIVPTVHAQTDSPFVSTWLVGAGESITIPTNPGFTNYDYTVDWGDNSTSASTGDATHRYEDADTYTISISGTFPAIYFNNGGDRNKIRTIKQWGTNPWLSMESAFRGCANLTIETDAGNPYLSGVTDMSQMFRSAFAFNSDISDWDVSRVTDMSQMFGGTQRFNQDLSGWDVSRVTNMRRTFTGTQRFNQDLSGWDVSRVTDMFQMFNSARAFNQDISGWDVSSVENMTEMFWNARAFNQDLSDWDVSSARFMAQMFRDVQLSTANYDSLLVGWSTIDSDESSLQQNVRFGGGNNRYCAAGEVAREVLTDNNSWIIANTDRLDTPENCVMVAFTGPGSIADQTYKVGDNVNFILPRAALGTPDYTYTLTGSIPTGLAFDEDTRALTGRPTRTTTVELVYTVTDSGTPTSINTMRFNLAIADPTPPTVVSAAFYKTITDADTDTGFITESFINEPVYAVIQFSEDIQNENTILADGVTSFMRGSPTIQHRHSSQTSIANPDGITTTTMSIIAYDADFGVGDQQCRAASATNTSRYLCQIMPLASAGYQAGPMQIVVPVDEYTRTFADNRLEDDYISPNSLTLLEPEVPTVSSVVHYPSTVTAQAGSSPISTTWESHDPIYSVIQFGGTINIIPPDISSFTEVPDARPQIFSQIGSAERVQFGYAPNTEFSMPPAGYCSLLAEEPGGRNPTFWCSYAPPSGSSGVYKIIVGTGTESAATVPVPLAQEYNADTGIMLNIPAATIEAEPGMFELIEGQNTNIDVSLSRIEGTGEVEVNIVATADLRAISTVTFTNTDSQSITVTAVNDGNYTGDRPATLTLTADDYSSTVVSVTIIEDDPRSIGLRVEPTDLSLERFTQAMIDIEANMDVDLNVATDGAVRLVVAPTTLTRGEEAQIEIEGVDVGEGTVTFRASRAGLASTVQTVTVTVSTPTLVIREVSPSAIDLLTSLMTDPQIANLDVRVNAIGNHASTITATVIGGLEVDVDSPIRTGVTNDTSVRFVVRSGITNENPTIRLTASHPDYNPVSVDVAVNVNLRTIGLMVDPDMDDLNITVGTTQALTITAMQATTATITISVEGDSNLITAPLSGSTYALSATIDEVNVDVVAGMSVGRVTLVIEATEAGYATETTRISVNVESLFSIQAENRLSVTENEDTTINVSLSRIVGGVGGSDVTVSIEATTGLEVVSPSSALLTFSSTDTRIVIVGATDDNDYTGARSATVTLTAEGYTTKTVVVNIEEDERLIGLTAVEEIALLRFATSTLTVQAGESDVMLSVETTGAVTLAGDTRSASLDLTGGETSAQIEIIGNSIGAGTVTFTVSSAKVISDPVVVEVTVGTPTLVISDVSALAIDLLTLATTELAVTVNALGGHDVMIMTRVAGDAAVGVSPSSRTDVSVDTPTTFTVSSGAIAGNATIRLTTSHPFYKSASTDVRVNVSLRTIGLTVNPQILDIVERMSKASTIAVSANTDVSINITAILGDASIARANSATEFTLTAVDNSSPIEVSGNDSGDTTVKIVASAPGYVTETQTIDVRVLSRLRIMALPDRFDLIENESTVISVSLTQVDNVGEGVTVNIEMVEGLSITPSITFTSTAARSVTVTAVNDDEDTDDRTVMFRLTAAGYVTKTVTVNITDNDLPPIGLDVGPSTELSLVRFMESEITVEADQDAALSIATEGAVSLVDPASAPSNLIADEEARIEILGDNIGVGTVTFRASANGFADAVRTVSVMVGTPTLVIREVSPSVINLDTSEMTNLDVRVNAIGNHASTITATVIGGLEVEVDSPIRTGVTNDTSVRFVVRSGITNENPTIRITASHPDYKPATVTITVNVRSRELKFRIKVFLEGAQ